MVGPFTQNYSTLATLAMCQVCGQSESICQQEHQHFVECSRQRQMTNQSTWPIYSSSSLHAHWHTMAHNPSLSTHWSRFHRTFILLHLEWGGSSILDGWAAPFGAQSFWTNWHTGTLDTNLKLACHISYPDIPTKQLSVLFGFCFATFAFVVTMTVVCSATAPAPTSQSQSPSKPPRPSPSFWYSTSLSFLACSRSASFSSSF